MLGQIKEELFPKQVVKFFMNHPVPCVAMKISRSCVRIIGAENLLFVVSRSQNEPPDPETGTSGL